MNIFLTGGTGFLGKFLTRFLKEKGHKIEAISSKDCDLTQPHSLDAWTRCKYDQIYHLAAWTQAGDFCLKHPGEQWLINQKINTHVLDWWQKSQPQAKLIAMGTSCSYDGAFPLREEHYLDGIPIDSLFSYAMTKRMLLCGLMALHKQYGLQYLYVVPSTLYGPKYHTDGRQMHFIFDLIRKILRAKLHQEPVVLWGDGEQKREIVHVQDFVQLLWEATCSMSNCVLNIGSGQEYSIRDFAKMICQHVDYPFEKIEFDLSRYVGARSKVLDIQKLRNAFPHFSPTPMDQGIRQVIDWFAQNPQVL